MNKNIRVMAISPRLKIADIEYNTRECISAAERAAANGADVLLTPELSLTGYTLADMFSHSIIKEAAKTALSRFAEKTKDLKLISFVGFPFEHCGFLYDCVAAVSGGRVLGIVPKLKPSGIAERSFSAPADIKSTALANEEIPFGAELKFTLNGAEIAVAIGGDISAMKPDFADIVLAPSAIEKTVGSRECAAEGCLIKSAKLGAAYVLATSGEGESGTDALFSPHNAIANCGILLSTAENFSECGEIVADISISEKPECTAPKNEDKFIKKHPKSPFISEDAEKRRNVCAEIFEIQSRALAGRLERAYAKCAVIGVSGGLDSTLALLVCARAADILGRDRKTVIAVTMPAFGTTARTKSNAEMLSEALGAEFLTVDIKRSVLSHFKDIGHDPENYNVVYENAQARERTQVIMDIANARGGIVVGTGDLSELALGFATYNGDHMSMYGVNAGIPKTVMRHVVNHCAEENSLGNVKDVLKDILATPVSPELLPPNEGEIAQCTEGIVGPYELHDYFLYHVLKCGYSPREIYSMATESFFGVYDEETVKGWLKVFFKRFLTQQFKRSCLPDGVRVFDISVSPRGALAMPSDMSAALWLSELETL